MDWLIDLIIIKHKSIYMLLTRDSLQSYVSLDTETVSKGMKKTFHENENDETVGDGNTHIRQNKP